MAYRHMGGWIGSNVLDGLLRGRATKGLMVMADPGRPRHYEEEFKRRIVQLYEYGKPAREIRTECDISRSTLHRWVRGPQQRFDQGGRQPHAGAERADRAEETQQASVFGHPRPDIRTRFIIVHFRCSRSHLATPGSASGT